MTTMTLLSSANAQKFWELDSAFEVKERHTSSPVRTMETFRFQKEVLSVNGETDTGERPSNAHLISFEEHQASLPRLPIPPLRDTCELYLKSIQAIASSEEYFYASKAVEEFLRPGGTGELLHSLLVKWDQSCDQPSWLEEFWDDSYLCTRDPIPVNVNYFFQLQPHPQQKGGIERVSQVGRAASLLHAATEYYLSILNGTVEKEFERDSPVCMSQYRYVFSTARVPGLHRDRKVCYSTRALTSDEKKSKFAEFVATDPKHCIIIIRNRYFKIQVLHDDGTQYSVNEIALALKHIENIVTSRKEPGAPIGLFTTLDRTDWFHARERLKALGNGEVLQAIQSAIICLCLDAVEVTSPDEAARLFLHGPGTNRWFDRHNIIVTRDGSAGINWEHSVADGGTTLHVADFMYRRDCERYITDKDLEELMQNKKMTSLTLKMISELNWSIDNGLDKLMNAAFADFKVLIQSNETHVLHFQPFGGIAIKKNGMSPDAFVQVALQLTFYRLFGRNCATYEAASTRTFSHGRTECVRSATRAVWDFCHAAADPVFSKRVGSYVPNQRDLLRTALDAHTNYMKLAKKGLGVDRHLYGLRVMGRMHGIPLPDIFTNTCFQRSATWLMSTSHCGSSALDAFGFGPVVGSGFGIGYMIKGNSMDFVITSKYTHPFTSSSVFASMLHSSLMHLESIVQSEKIGERANGHTLVFSHPFGLNDFEYTQQDGFLYQRYAKESLRELAHTMEESGSNESSADVTSGCSSEGVSNIL
ncbi:putative choline/carnitine O-acetyltransferase [Trypanosoma theileri]|uniref:Putative choline/carnitine O-acetyltransferase n=1 Tax=Trypanosoma theileri TaxID=67003 RepID=A0A1X0P523_9TRYP|nr:putative choline/carnitine O-acetyltransferase [Trypanosoma theileri]ORC91753.1 putative choline/carnitine O-acetyltransferase [Trypanosoma theileri]